MGSHQSCYNANWWHTLESEGWSHCNAGYACSGLWRHDCSHLSCIEEGHCCRAHTGRYYGCNNANVWSCLDHINTWCGCSAGRFISGIYRSSENNLFHNIEEFQCCGMWSCPAGKYQNEYPKTSCKSCPAGKYQGSGGATGCSKCAKGKYQNSATSSSCKNCPSGKYQDGTGNSGCKSCPAGKYQNSAGQHGCKNCPAGQYQDGTTKTSCKSCPAGKYQNGAGNSACKSCPAGQYQNNGGHSSCKSCPSGQYQGSTGQTSCKSCAAGKFQDGTGNSACKNCPAGKYQGSTGKTSCGNCPAGDYQNSAGQTSCKSCPGGKYTSGSGKSSCTSCPYGQYQPSSRQTSCSNCPAGKYQDETAKTSCKDNGGSNYYSSDGQRHRTTVTTGYYSTGGSATTRTGQTHCTPGYYCVSGVRHQCPTGKYTNVNEATSCTDCAPGYYQPNIQQTGCLACGHNNVFCPGAEASTRTVQIGWYSIGGGAATRNDETVCTPGYFCVSGVRYSCPVGKYTPANGYTECLLCAASTYNSRETQSVCPVCPEGSYTPNTGMSSCMVCEPGYYCTAGVRYPCGGYNKFCPGGENAPHDTTEGWYSTGGDEFTRSGQTPAEPGFWATGGFRRECGGANHYCPGRENYARVVDNDFYSVGGATDRVRNMQLQCEFGYYCYLGVRYPCGAEGPHGLAFPCMTYSCAPLVMPGMEVTCTGYQVAQYCDLECDDPTESLDPMVAICAPDVQWRFGYPVTREGFDEAYALAMEDGNHEIAVRDHQEWRIESDNMMRIEALYDQLEFLDGERGGLAESLPAPICHRECLIDQAVFRYADEHPDSSCLTCDDSRSQSRWTVGLPSCKSHRCPAAKKNCDDYKCPVDLTDFGGGGLGGETTFGVEDSSKPSPFVMENTRESCVRVQDCDPESSPLCHASCAAAVSPDTASCLDIQRQHPEWPNGFYCINILGTVARVFCQLDRSFDNGGWTALIDPDNGVSPTISLEGAAEGGYVPWPEQHGEFGVKGTDSIDRGGNGFAVASIAVPHPAFSEVRVYFRLGEQCNVASDSPDSLTDIDFGSTKDWLTKMYPRASPGGDGPVRCWGVNEPTEPRFFEGPRKAAMSGAASASTVVEFGSECGPTECTHAEWARYKYIYVR